MDLATFNRLTVEEASTALLPCVDVPRWVADVVGGRPFDDTSALMLHAEHAAPRWTEEELDRALLRHPRIGEQRPEPSAEADLSRQEQGALALSGDVADLIRTGNRSYEDTFGHVFLIRATGRSSTEILPSLDQRLGNPPQEERRIVAHELREIALLRLSKIIDP